MDRVLEEEEEQFSVVLTTTDDAITIGRQFATVTIIDSEGMCWFVCFISCVVYYWGHPQNCNKMSDWLPALNSIWYLLEEVTVYCRGLCEIADST